MSQTPRPRVERADGAAGSGEGGPPRWRAATVVVIACGLAVSCVSLLLGPPAGDDAYMHAVHAQQQARCWLSGVPVPDWYPDLNAGLGGPEPRAYPLGTLTIQGLMALVLDDGIAATSAAAAAIPLLAALLTLGSLKARGAPPLVAAAVAIAWCGCPYVVVAVHQRAALAEGWGLAVLPWVLLNWLPPEPVGPRGLARGALAFALLLTLQLPLAYMVAVVVMAAQLAAFEARRIAAAAGAALLGTGLAASSWLPNLVAARTLDFRVMYEGSYHWSNHFLPGGRPDDPVLAVNLLLGGAVLVVTAGLLATWDRGARGLAVGSLLAVGLATPLAAWAYRVVPGFADLQFPWRWLGPASCLLVLAAARGRPRLAVIVAAAFLATSLSTTPWRWRLPAGPPMRPRDALPLAAEAAQRYGMPPALLSLPAYLPRGVDLLATLRQGRQARAGLRYVAGDGATEWLFQADLSSEAEVTVPLLIDRGWVVEVDGDEVGWAPRDGLVAVRLPRGSHRLGVRRETLPEYAAGGIITFVSAGVLLLGICAGCRRVAKTAINGP